MSVIKIGEVISKNNDFICLHVDIKEDIEIIQKRLLISCILVIVSFVNFLIFLCLFNWASSLGLFLLLESIMIIIVTASVVYYSVSSYKLISLRYLEKRCSGIQNWVIEEETLIEYRSKELENDESEIVEE